MVEIGKYYKMVKHGYTHRYYVKDIEYNTNNQILYLYAIYYDGNSEYYDSTISNSDFWNDNKLFEEITVDQFIMDYKGYKPLPVKSDIFHTLLF